MLNRIYKDYCLPLKLYENVKKSLRYQYKNDIEDLLKFVEELPQDLRIEVSLFIFEKTFRMSNACNKDYSSGEIMSLIHRDSGRVWSFVWDLNDFLEIPFEFIVSAYYLYTNLGWSAFSGVGLYALLW